MNNEILGLAATAFVLVSFSMNNVKAIRIVNILGATLFVIYGTLIGSLSTWLLNGILIAIHIYKLFLKK